MVDTDQERVAFKDPRPTVERISQLAQRVLTGDILLPKFQRDFVWPREKVLGLLDSIARNYPIGSILLWQSRQELASERTIGGLNIADRKPDYPVNYLLDGQQRLSTVCGALHWKPDGDPDSIWNIVFDVQADEFVHLHSLGDPPLTQIPVRLLSDPANFFRRVSAIEGDAARVTADALFNRFQDYMIAAVTLGDMPIDDIAPIFERVNSKGTPLTIVDLMRAATWDPAFDLRDAIDGILQSLATRNYDSIDRKTVLRSVAAGADYGFAVDDIDKLRNKNVDELRQVIGEVTEAAKKSVDFLTTHIRAPRPQSLPYTNQFAVLTEIFRRVPAPHNDQFAELENWFWRTTLSGYFGGWNTGQMSSDWRAIKEFAEAIPGTPLDVPASLPRKDIWKVSQFRANSAVSKMLALMLSYAGPVDMLTGQRLDVGKSLSWSNDKEYHHFFPRDYLKGQDVPGGRANAVGNIVLLSSLSNIGISNSAPSRYLRQLIDSVGREEAVGRLGTLLVSEEALECALVDDYPGFLEARSMTLHERALQLVGESMAEESDSGAPGVGEISVDDAVNLEAEADPES
ncbi:hypothetical protein TPA0598_01_10560 [Streptomyces lydicamycinicus]|uniref:GmrSD restriction endonucleases N-terminal domain-containing protein n=1 Tax=Streptomyces lydicamycinicus TaxID=1546107 RepID=A0A0P4R1W4_9ACTN|nr:DUF262 domain-containing protein [Streptomyces lydicamycinicus]GAO06684.1 hypothetical protein TPA0598_01_10560 [Streptomyces lydicamycinicus]